LPLLPTPQARDHHGAQLPEQRRAGGHQVNLNDTAIGLAKNWERDSWGQYGQAIRRWEQVTGRPAPFPAEPGRNGQPRLSPAFAEWIMQLPEGWVTGVRGLPYSAMIRVIGNGVVPAQATAALRRLTRLAAVPCTALPADLMCPHEVSIDAAGPGRKASLACTPAPSGARGRLAPPAARAPQPRSEAGPRAAPAAANADAPRNRGRAA
jgi:hypothetical protein